MPRCTVHLHRAAGWRCTGCQRTLCPGCVIEVEVDVGATSYVRCGLCDGRVDVLMRPGSDVSFARALSRTLRLPLSLPGLVVLYGLSVVASELDALAPPGRWPALLLWSVAAWLVGVAIVRAAAEGASGPSDVQHSPWPNFIRPALLAALLTAPTLLVPRTGWPGALLVAAAAPLLVPMLLAVFAGVPLAQAVNPTRATRTLLGLGRDGGLAVVATCFLWLFARMLAGAAEVPATEVPTLWLRVADVVAAFSLFLVPHVLGLLVEARGEDMGYPFRARGEVTALPHARPEASTPYRPPEAPVRPRPGPIALEETADVLELEPLAPGPSKAE
jgi:hypothetical protein